jgi:hypothetical protein
LVEALGAKTLKIYLVCIKQRVYGIRHSASRVLNDTPGFAAIAPGECFNALAIFVTPCLSLVIDHFTDRSTSFVHVRLRRSIGLRLVGMQGDLDPQNPHRDHGPEHRQAADRPACHVNRNMTPSLDSRR